jgi:hypothetical protein
MSLHKFVGCSAAAVVAAGAMLASVLPTQAIMFRVAPSATPFIQHVDCAVGFHLGPAGACILGTPDAPPAGVIVEHHDGDVGCETKSVTRSDAMGNSETKTKTNC